jgi:hypothetical protein
MVHACLEKGQIDSRTDRQTDTVNWSVLSCLSRSLFEYIYVCVCVSADSFVSCAAAPNGDCLPPFLVVY